MTLRVVLVDDEPYSREMFNISANLTEMNMELSATLEDPHQLLDRLDEYKPDIVITDIRMPGMDGLELIRRLKNKCGEDIAFILLSAYSQVEYAKQAIQLGIRYYVVKPYLPMEINDVLKKVGDELREARVKKDQAVRINRSLLGRRILQLIYSKEETNLAPLPCFIRYGSVGLFATDAAACIRDITSLHELLTNDYEISIVIRQPSKVEFVFFADTREKLEEVGLRLKDRLETNRLEHDYYTAVGSIAQNQEDILHSYYDMCEIAAQATWREDRHWMESVQHMPKRLITNRLPEIITAMELGEKEKASLLIRDQIKDYRDALTSPYVLQVLTDQIVYRSLSLNIVSDSDALFTYYEKKLCTVDHLFVEQAEDLLIDYCDHFISLLQSYQAQLRVRDDPAALIRAYIDAHYSEQLTVQRIADELFFHPAYIGVLYKKNMGVSIHQYLHQVRINHAIELMEANQMTLTQIALEVGYNDYPSFVAAFRQIRGVSPSGFRRKKKLNEIENKD